MEMKNLLRWVMANGLLVGGLVLVSPSWAQSPSAPGHYTITLSEWDPNQIFTFIPDPDPSTVNPSGFDFSDAGFCPSGNWEQCLCHDPAVRLNNNGKSQSENGEFTFQADEEGNLNGAASDFANTGPPITEALIITTLGSDQMNKLFTCNGGSLFSECGFMDPQTNAGDELEILFIQGTGTGIPTAVPEPSQWIFLLVACAGLVAVKATRVRRQRSGSLTVAAR